MGNINMNLHVIYKSYENNSGILRFDEKCIMGYGVCEGSVLYAVRLSDGLRDM